MIAVLVKDKQTAPAYKCTACLCCLLKVTGAFDHFSQLCLIYFKLMNNF